MSFFLWDVEVNVCDIGSVGLVLYLLLSSLPGRKARWPKMHNIASWLRQLTCKKNKVSLPRSIEECFHAAASETICKCLCLQRTHSDSVPVRLHLQ